MARIIVIGGGVGGLTTAMLLARDGHDVTVLERDPAAPPDSADEAWDALGAARRQPVPHDPHVPAAFSRAAWRRSCRTRRASSKRSARFDFNPLALIPAEMTGGFRPGEDEASRR